MLRPFLIVGVGGSGGKTLRGLKVALERRLKSAGWNEPELPEAWQFLHIDTPVTQDGAGFPAPFLPNDEYLGVVPPGIAYPALVQNLTGKAFGIKLSPDELEQFGGWIPSPNEVKVPVAMGAGQFRAIGRTLAVSRLDAIRTKLYSKLSGIDGAAARAELGEVSQQLGHGSKIDSAPMILVISSIAGGSGAGAYLDVIEAIKSCSQEPWARRVVAWLYTPDVFKGIDGAGGVAPNSLAVLAETMAGLWAPVVTQGTRKLYQSKGVIPPANLGGNVGAAYTFLIGRKNGAADFGTQEDVYLAASSSLAAFMTNAVAQDDFWAYYITNLDAQASLEAVLPDRSQLKVNNLQRPPFLAMGFGRLSMGRDRFREFAGQRLARDLVERLLDGHLRDIDVADRREATPDELIQAACDSQWLSFLEGSKINERNPSNDVVEAVTPEDRSTRVAKYQSLIQSGAGVPAAGASPQVWQTKLQALVSTHKQGFLDEDAVPRNAKARAFVEEISTHLPRHAADYAVQVGLPATVRLLTKLSDEIAFAANELEGDIGKIQRMLAELPAKLAEPLSSAGMAALPPNNPNVQKAIQRAAQALEFEARVESHALARDILRDLDEGIVRPLTRALQNAEAGLRETYKAERLTSGSRNPALDWPDPRQDSVPPHFSPPPNERVMLQTDEYVSEYTRLVTSTLPQDQRGRQKNNEFAVAKMFALGAGMTAPDGGPSRLGYEFIGIDQDWVPKIASIRPAAAQGASTAARYSVLADALAYVGRADSWLTQEGSPFGEYIDEPLLRYLEDGAAPDAELMKRRQRFITEFSAALSASKPLININNAIAAAIHPGVNCEAAANTISPIPFDPSSTFGKMIVELFPSGQSKPPIEWFRPAPKATDITIDSFLSNPMQPMVFNSIMEPVAAQWAQVSPSLAARAGFYQWRRARPLLESVPCAPQQAASLVRGWMLADIFGQIKPDLSNSALGTRIEVWDPTLGWVAFPHPLLHPGTPQPGEYIGVVLESLSIALVHCNSSGDNALAPLRPYHRLMDLGGESAAQGSPELLHWVNTGTLPAGAESLTPNAKTLPGIGTDAAARVQFLLEQLKKRKANFDEVKRRVDETGDPYTVSRAWEVHELRMAAISELEKVLGELSTEDQMM